MPPTPTPNTATRGPTASVWKVEVHGTIDGLPIHERFTGISAFAKEWGDRTNLRFDRTKVHRLMAGKMADPRFDCTVTRINIPRQRVITYESGVLSTSS
jgi:hypothetical protein